MRAWVAYCTFKTPHGDEGFCTVRNVLGANLLLQLANNEGPRSFYTTFPGNLLIDEHVDFIT